MTSQIVKNASKSHSEFSDLQSGDILVSYEIIRVKSVNRNHEHPHAEVFVNGKGQNANNDPFIYSKVAIEGSYHSTQHQAQEVVTSTQMSEILGSISWEAFRCEWFKQATDKVATERMMALSTSERDAILSSDRRLRAWMRENALVGEYRQGVVVKPNSVTREEDERNNPTTAVSTRSTGYSSEGNKLQGKVQVIDLNKTGHRNIQIIAKNIISITLKGVLYINKDFKKYCKYV